VPRRSTISSKLNPGVSKTTPPAPDVTKDGPRPDLYSRNKIECKDRNPTTGQTVERREGDEWQRVTATLTGFVTNKGFATGRSLLRERPRVVV
jgi:hypothetical protein